MKKTLGHIHFSLKLLIFIWLVGSFFMFFKQQFQESTLCREYQGVVSGWYWCSENSFRLEEDTPNPKHLNPFLWPIELFEANTFNLPEKTPEKP